MKIVNATLQNATHLLIPALTPQSQPEALRILKVRKSATGNTMVTVNKRGKPWTVGVEARSARFVACQQDRAVPSDSRDFITVAMATVSLAISLYTCLITAVTWPF